jgi:hypothetical protein
VTQELYIADAGPRGKGVFAGRDIPRGRVVISFGGDEDWIWNIPRADWEYALQVDYDRYILPRRGSPAWFINHSCHPNCVLVSRSDVKSWRKISRGEEVTIDYSTNVGWDEFEMVCACGSEGCRKLVRSYIFLPDDLKKRYGRNVSPYLLEKRT